VFLLEFIFNAVEHVSGAANFFSNQLFANGDIVSGYYWGCQN
jgi:hypothetical protein